METVKRQYNFLRLFKRLIFAYASNSYLLVSKIRRILYKWGGGKDWSEYIYWKAGVF